MPPKSIIHLDMDAFYASVEVLDNPALRGLPVIVGGLGSRGVVSTASYEARARGVHSALPMTTARRRCPEGVYIRPRPWRYKEISDQVMAVFHRYTPLVEPLSLDEAFLDVTGSLRLFGPAEEIARRVKAEVFQETNLTVTAGVASQKHLAKIASGLNKPDGLTVVPPGGELDFLRPLPLGKLWGVGRVTLESLKSLGLMTIGDLAALERNFLEKRFGKSGLHLWELANGLDAREVEPRTPAKSISAEETFAENLINQEEIRAALLAQAMTAARRLRGQGFKCRTVTAKFRDGEFKTRVRAKSLPRPTDLRDEIYKATLELYEKEAPALGPMRLLGVSLSRLSRAEDFEGEESAPGPEQLSLFNFESKTETERESVKRSEKLNRALDQVTGKFGINAVKPATLSKFK